MGSVSCIVVWACECWAFIRFYNWYVCSTSILSTYYIPNIPSMSLHRDELNAAPQFAHLRRFRNPGTEDLYPWRSHGQPMTMYLALFGCLFVLAVADGSALWHNWVAPRFLSAYLSVSIPFLDRFSEGMLMFTIRYYASSHYGWASSSIIIGEICNGNWKTYRTSSPSRGNCAS